MTHTATRLDAAERVSVADAALPERVPEGSLRLELATASLCGTDLHYYRHFANAGFELRRPLTLGHEACATVLDANGAGFAAGELVAIDPILACGTCPSCARGVPNHCRDKRFPGSGTTVPHIDGFFQARFDFPASACRHVARGTRPDHLTFAEPLACSMHAVNLAGVGAGDALFVSGCGPMGLLAVVAARAAGARVTAGDVRPEAVALALEAGADEGVVIGRDDVDRLAEGFDAVVEASGAHAAFNLALELVRREGTVIVLSNIQPRDATVHLHRIMLKEIAVRGSLQYAHEFADAVALIESATIDFERLTAARFPLERAAEAFALMAGGGAAGKILLQGPGGTLS